MSGERVIRHLNVIGRVQGVGFRAFVEEQAFRHQVEGWVRNRRDGSVEALLAGASGEVEAMIAACHKGPLGARVDALYQREGTDAELALRGIDLFSVLATA
ncbi:MAG: acylphosphatase [Pseudolabrys sp.]